LHVVRTAGTFDAATVPIGLQQHHCIAQRTWASLRVIEGSVALSMATTIPVDRLLRAGDHQPIPPDVPHALLVDGPVRLEIDFLVRTR
jgi:tellurite resistance-related uncharacterized protein